MVGRSRIASVPTVRDLSDIRDRLREHNGGGHLPIITHAEVLALSPAGKVVCYERVIRGQLRYRPLVELPPCTLTRAEIDAMTPAEKARVYREFIRPGTGSA
jgi:hypothetical protein